MLFDISKDPHEQSDVKQAHPDICAKGAKLILDWQDEMQKKSCDAKMVAADPLWTVLTEGGPAHTKGALDGYIKRLRQTGREDGAAKLERKYKKG